MTLHCSKAQSIGFPNSWISYNSLKNFKFHEFSGSEAHTHSNQIKTLRYSTATIIREYLATKFQVLLEKSNLRDPTKSDEIRRNPARFWRTSKFHRLKLSSAARVFSKNPNIFQRYPGIYTENKNFRISLKRSAFSEKDRPAENNSKKWNFYVRQNLAGFEPIA